MTLKQAIKKLGGPHKAAAVSGIPRTVIIYWLHVRIPKWRQPEVNKLIELASAK